MGWIKLSLVLQLKDRADTIERQGKDQRWRAHIVRTVPLLREAAKEIERLTKLLEEKEEAWRI
jgi:hypothetical protein